MKKIILIVLFALTFTLCVNANGFSDVPKDHWAYDSVNMLYEKGILKGDKFAGDEIATRFYFAAVLARLMESLKTGQLQVSDISYEDYERVNRLSVEFANELNVFGYRLKRIRNMLDDIREKVDVLKKDKKVNGPVITWKVTGDLRLRNSIHGVNYAYDDGSIAGANDTNFIEQTFGMNFNLKIGENLTYINRWENVWYHNPVINGSAGADWPANQTISLGYFNYDGPSYSFSGGRQFFNVANALFFSDKDNGFKYTKMLSEDSDIVLAATKESLTDSNSSLNTFVVNYLKYLETGVLNTYTVFSNNPLWQTASASISGNTNSSSSVNYYGIAYKDDSRMEEKYFLELSAFSYADTVSDFATNGATGADIGTQMAYQLGYTKMLNPMTDIRFIYTHQDDFYKPLKKDATITMPDYDDLGFGTALNLSGGFNSYYIRVENYLRGNASLVYSLEMIADDSTLANGQIADDRMVYGVKYDKNISGAVLSLEYKMVDAEKDSATADVRTNGFGTDILTGGLSGNNGPSVETDARDPYDEYSFIMTLTHAF
ncbi:MAG: hypothetical protein C0601_11070 [Candidatus Muiribacterium halophilum]|uniref:SLH domain-containing protein n=1 Tax=Muiribacterium halophilum TaxID=2053465 RepID=A0A2N5ZBW4_MUIH1|nr:MAG: hypothetical protein C0601_11070 [Candidatus Muirbacterium halophilum]